MAAASVTPQLPDGFELENSATPALPPGFEFEGAAAPPSMGADIAKSAGSGLLQGAEGVLGLPGDLESLVRTGLNKIMPLPEGAKIGGGIPAPPTSAAIGDAIQGATGIQPYQPQTTPGKYAKTIGAFIPAAIAGPEGVGSNIGKFALLPGAASEALGEHFEGSPLEGPARVAGAIIGGGTGIAAGRGVQGAQDYLAARDAASNIGPDANAAAVPRMAKSFAADNLDPSIVAAKMQQLGPEAMALDMGRQMQGRAEAIAAQPGEGQNTVLDAVQQRVHGLDQFGNVQQSFGQASADRVKQTLDAQLGTASNKVDLLNNVRDITRAQAKPLYDAVMDANPVVNVPQSITSRPVIAQAMNDATSLAKNYGEKLQSPAETQTILSGPGYHIADDVAAPAQTSLRYWDYVKKSLDSRINGMLGSGGIETLDSADKADLGGLIDARNALRDHLDQVTNGDYATARKAGGMAIQLPQAYDLGRAAFNNQLLPEEFADQMDNMSAPEQVMAKAGFRRELERTIDVARNDGASARRMLDTNSNLQKVENLFGPDARQAVENRVGAETNFQNAANNIAGNSRTAVRLQASKDTESPSGALPPMANIQGLIYKGIGQGLQSLRNQGVEGTRAALGNMLTTQGPQLTNLADVLARYNATRAANAGTPVGRQVSALGRTLLLNPSTGPAQTAQ